MVTNTQVHLEQKCPAFFNPHGMDDGMMREKTRGGWKITIYRGGFSLWKLIMRERDNARSKGGESRRSRETREGWPRLGIGQCGSQKWVLEVKKWSKICGMQNSFSGSISQRISESEKTDFFRKSFYKFTAFGFSSIACHVCNTGWRLPFFWMPQISGLLGQDRGS